MHVKLRYLLYRYYAHLYCASARMLSEIFDWCVDSSVLGLRRATARQVSGVVVVAVSPALLRYGSLRPMSNGSPDHV